MHNTGNPIGSDSLLDLYDNSSNIDQYVNSQEDTFPDRFGVKRLTLAGLIKRSMALRNEINDFSGALTFKPEWSDVPMNVSEGVGGEGGALNLQAEALGNRSEINKITSREALRRSYAEADYTLVTGSFEAGGTLVKANDVLLQERTGKVFSGPAGTVAAGTNPASGGFVDRSGESLRGQMAATDGAKLIGEVDSFSALRSIEPTVAGQLIKLAQHTNPGVGGGDFYYDESDTTTADDNGYVAVTTAGKRWKRRTNGGPIYAADFGAAAGVALDSVVANCMTAAARLSATKIVLPYAPVSNPCTLVGGMSFETPPSGIEIAGPGEWLSCAVSHTGDNTGIAFTKGASTTLFSQAKLAGIRVLGNSGASACFAEFQDSWGCGVKDFFGSGYSNSHLIRLHNRTGWTEGFHMQNVMSRSNKAMVAFKRTAASGGTGSFFGLYARDVWHRFGVGNSLAFDLSDSAAPLLLYGADIEIGGWFESGGGHRYFAVGANNSFVDSVVTLRADGFGGMTDGSDLYLFRTSASTSRIDVEARTLCQQGNSINVSALASGSVVGSVRHIVSQNNKFDHVNSRPCCRVKGAKIRFIQTGITTDKTLVIDNLPSYSTWKATLTANGSNVEFVEEYRIEVGEQNWLARVVSLGVTATATVDTINANIKLQAVGGGTGGGFSASGGSRFEWKMFAATLAATYESTLELEML